LMAASACEWVLYTATTEFIVDIYILLCSCEMFASALPGSKTSAFLLRFERHAVPKADLIPVATNQALGDPCAAAAATSAALRGFRAIG